jgi:hypothetical protein
VWSRLSSSTTKARPGTKELWFLRYSAIPGSTRENRRLRELGTREGALDWVVKDE